MALSERWRVPLLRAYRVELHDLYRPGRPPEVVTIHARTAASARFMARRQYQGHRVGAVTRASPAPAQPQPCGSRP